MNERTSKQISKRSRLRGNARRRGNCVEKYAHPDAYTGNSRGGQPRFFPSDSTMMRCREISAGRMAGDVRAEEENDRINLQRRCTPPRDPTLDNPSEIPATDIWLEIRYRRVHLNIRQCQLRFARGVTISGLDEVYLGEMYPPYRAVPMSV